MRRLIPALRPIAFAIVACVDVVERMLASSGSLYRILLIPGFERLRWRIGVWRAWRSYYRTYRDVPAYRQFIDLHGGKPLLVLAKIFCRISAPSRKWTRKATSRNSARSARARRQASVKGVMVDELSGSSGQPTRWVRGAIERRITSQMMRLSYRLSVRKGERVFILTALRSVPGPPA